MLIVTIIFEPFLFLLYHNHSEKATVILRFFVISYTCYMSKTELISKQSTGLFTTLKAAASGEKQEVTS